MKTLYAGTKKWIWIGAVAATALLAICLFTICLALKKRKFVFQGSYVLQNQCSTPLNTIFDNLFSYSSYREEKAKDGDEDGTFGNL